MANDQIKSDMVTPIQTAARALLDLRLNLLDSEEDGSQTDWSRREAIARLLEERPELLEALLDSAKEMVEDGAAPRGDAEEVERYFQRGLRSYQHGEYRQAVNHFTVALKLDPNDARLYAYRGDAYRLQCDYERASADFTRALRLEPSDPFVLISRANTYHCKGEHTRAVADCSAVLEADPNNATAYRIRAAAQAELGVPELALADLTTAIALAPQDEEAHYQRGVLRVSQRDYVRASADFDRVIKLNAHHAPAYLQRGYVRRCQQDFLGAIGDYNVVLRYHPSNVPALVGRGSAHRLMGDLKRAQADYQEALLLEPDNAPIYCSQGILFRIKGELERAKEVLTESIRLDRKHWPALYHRSKVFLAQGRFPDALADLTAVLSLNPRLVPAYLSRAVVYNRLGHYQEALTDGSHAVKADARSSAAYLVRGVAYAQLGRRVEAVEDLTQAIQLNPRFALAYHERSVAYSLGGEHDRALDDCNQLLALEPGNAQAYAHRSILYHLKGDLPKALEDYNRAMQLDANCLMMGLHQGLAERAREQTAQRLAEYIDGLRQEPIAAEPPPPAKFRIVVQPAEVKEAVSAFPAPTEKGTPHADSSSDPSVLRADATATANAAKGNRRQPAEQVRRKQKGASRGKPKTIAAKAAPVQETNRHQAIPTEQIHLIAEKATEDEASEVIAAQLLSEDGVPEEDTGLALRTDTAQTDDSAKTPRSLPSSPVADRNPVNRPLWKPTKQRPKVQKQEEEAEDSLFVNLRRPRVLLSAGVAVLLLIGFSFASLRSDRVRVVPAKGQALFSGKPMPGALITLEPVWTKAPVFPLPRATVKDDGSFVLGTYSKEDGAPTGEYRVSVRWLMKANKKPEVEGGALPVNVLPTRYSKFETSGLTVTIEEKDNVVPALQLRY